MDEAEADRWHALEVQADIYLRNGNANAYEICTLADVRARANEVGARQGGFLRFHALPFWVRMGIFALLTGAVWYLAWPLILLGQEWAVGDELQRADALTWVGLAAVCAYWSLRAWWRSRPRADGEVSPSGSPELG